MIFLACLLVSCSISSHAFLSSRRYTIMNNMKVTLASRQSSALQMAVYSSEKGVPAALVEERDACGVGFIASLDNKPSHSILQQALWACTCMEHRGATSADNISGDGAGVMTSIPWKLFENIAAPDSALNKDGTIATAVAMIFLPKAQREHDEAVLKAEQAMERNGFVVKGWRDVPVDASVLGALSRDFVPQIKQIVVQTAPGKQFDTFNDFDKHLYETRRQIQGYFRKVKSAEGYICSLSSRTIVYKGMLRSCDLSKFYLDLSNPEYSTNFAVYHRRFSTNTVPKWFLAQPMRMLAHNGEINTLLGNINWVKSRQYALRATMKDSKEDLERPLKGPLVDVRRSDSANLDSILESFVKAGYNSEEALMILVPEAYENQPRLKDQAQIRAFYRYYEALQEAWDGPALLVFSDGVKVGASLDRNGLRPARYMLTKDKEGRQLVHVMSEVGVTKILSQFSEEGEGVELLDSGRLGPGEMLVVNLQEKQLLLNREVKASVASRKPYPEMVQETVVELVPKSFEKDVGRFVQTYLPSSLQGQALGVKITEQTDPVALALDSDKLIAVQGIFGWGTEDVEVQISAMAGEGNEATYCMGDDAPLAALSSFPHTLYDYFKQRFAQVTNPPIDPLREGAVMSLAMFLGPRGDPTAQSVQTTRRVKITSPVLNSEELLSISQVKGMNMQTISTLYPVTQALSQGGLKRQLDAICEQAIAAVRGGANLINLSDMLPADLSSWKDHSYIPPLLAVGSVHHSLLKAGLRPQVSIIITTAQAWSPHHFACLVGYGASAVVPYAAFDAVVNWHGQKRVQLAMQRGDLPSLSLNKALNNFRKAIDKGLLKILSKMGISLLTSYHAAQIFEAIGLNDGVVESCFSGTACRVQGMSYDDIAAEVVDFTRKTFGDDMFINIIDKVEGEEEGGNKKLFNYGFLNYFKSGEYHHNNQPLIKTLHSAIRQGDYDLYKMYEESVQSRPPTTLRDMLKFVEPEKRGSQSIPIEEVESLESIMQRFVTGGMSLGALSREAHETLAIAMNRIGGKSNSGEGGEDPLRFTPIHDVQDGLSPSFPTLKGLKQGDLASSKVKQVASGRFGVTPQYLMSGEQLEIKVAQGAKPGEGGQLPGAKIDAYIATLRKSKPGVTLISPPPHHDIYSIEDLSQLIYDLKQINPAAGVSVKLVSEEGIGTIASGVAKAGADIIQISGHDGGTGASPLSSIKHAGSPWELGLVEAHSVLRKNVLRERVLLRVDGGLKSGWDVVMGAAMGGEEFGFGTIALIAEGCIMARICHTNKCPVGVTTQNEALRKRFPGTPENVVQYFSYVAQEVREILAKLGFKSLEEVIGRPGLLEPRAAVLKKASNVDVSYLLDNLFCAPERGENFCDIDEVEGSGDRQWLKHGPVHSNGHTFDDIWLENMELQAAIAGHGMYKGQGKIKNTDRTAFARISGILAKQYGDNNFRGLLDFSLTGAAGQSFGAFLSHNMHVNLKGYANDYVGKGMAGGLIAISPPAADLAHGEGRSLAGNTVLYGATGGRLFVRGRAGERFGVRNSGATAVVEGLGDHGCEYMTAGVVVNLGNIGRNFAAGMTGGLAFLHAPAGVAELQEYVNMESVTLQPLGEEYGAAREMLRKVLEEHAQHTGSAAALKVLSDAKHFGDFVIVVPTSEKNNALVMKSSQVSAASVALNA